MNPDNQINELNKIMNQITITNESALHTTIRNKQYIIGSFHPTTGISFSKAPAVQYSAIQARAECKRLAKLHPGKTFVFVRLDGGEMTVAQPKEVSI
jgi:hypothetical protein